MSLSMVHHEALEAGKISVRRSNASLEDGRKYLVVLLEQVRSRTKRTIVFVFLNRIYKLMKMPRFLLLRFTLWILILFLRLLICTFHV